MFVGIHGQATTALFTYKGEGHALKIQIEESGFHTDCEIKTINVDELVEVDFRHEDRLCRVICKVPQYFVMLVLRTLLDNFFFSSLIA